MSTPRLKLLDWRWRLLIDVVLLFGTLFALDMHDAPRWTYFLVVFISTRGSRLDTAADMAALQSTYRVRLESIQSDVVHAREQIERLRLGR